MHSFHLVQVPPQVSVAAMRHPPTFREAPGLRHVETMATMQLGAPVVSSRRLQLRRLALFAAWEDEAALECFLASPGLGRRVQAGWHVRLELLRRWGSVGGLDQGPEIVGRSDPAEPVVAVTLARMRFPEVPRFIHWGRPVERLVRDHPAVTLALAAARLPRTVSTFSIWRSAREMTAMVHGRSEVPAPARHAEAMVERERRDFHHEFTTLRYRPVSEHGSWDGRTGLVPGLR